MPTTQTTQTWLGKVFAKVASWFGNASGAIHDVVVIADNVANAIKSSPLTPVVETLLEKAIPASTGLVEAFKLELPNIVTKLNWAVAESSKTPDQLVADGLAYLQTLKGTDQYVIALHSFAATVQKWFSDNLGYGLTIQMALTSPQVVHNPALLDIANEVVSVVNTVVKDTTPTVADIPTPVTTETVAQPGATAYIDPNTAPTS